MVSPRKPGRRREWGLRVAGLAAALALGWAGLTVHEGLRTAADVAVARLSGEAVDAVLAEWERMRLEPEPPVTPSGPLFRWGTEEPLEPLELREPDPDPTSVFDTLVAEAERLEVVEDDDAAALEMLLSALDEHPEAPRRWIARLRTMQLAVRLNDAAIVRAQWELIRECPIEEASDGIPCRLLAWMTLPPEVRKDSPSEALVAQEDLLRIYLDGDRLDVLSTEGRDWPLGEPDSEFTVGSTPGWRILLDHQLTGGGVEVDYHPAPLLVLLLQRLRMQLASWEPRELHALERFTGGLPDVETRGRWSVIDVLGFSFLVRRDEATTGFFFLPGDLQLALLERVGPLGRFALDFSGAADELGVAVRPRSPLPGTSMAFTLRHPDPASLGTEESSRLRLLRTTLFALALACAGGGWLTARVLARERRLAELRSSFIAGVSHDLRTPLASILLLAENLESGVADGEARGRYHRALRKEATRLRRLIDDVLDFSRLERGRGVSVEPEDVALPAAVAGLVDEARAHVESAGRAFDAEVGELPPEAALDLQALRRALENLVENALRHGRGTVHVSVACADGRLALTVGDDGPGVPLAHAERAFDAFERLSANGHVGGAGLGLAIVRAVARGHGGDARVVPAGPGERTVFELTLPLEGSPTTA